MFDSKCSVLEARGIHVCFDSELGQIAVMRTSWAGREAAPFHRVPWANEELSGVDIPPHLRRMSVDFFCAPFAASDIEEAPLHGWSANGVWREIDESHFDGGMSRTYRLQKSIMGASLIKILTVRDDHPFLYQTHRFEGGAGRIPVAHHAMVQFPQTGLLSFSRKLRVESPPSAPESDERFGRSAFLYPACGSVAAFPLQSGGSVDLGKYPIVDRHEDLLLLVEDPSNPIGWAAAVRPEQNDVAIVLKSPRQLPVTMLWYSNGGRFYRPWDGRHCGVLGIEEACTNFALGHRASVEESDLSRSGVQTAISLDNNPQICTAIGALSCADIQSRVCSIRVEESHIVVDFEREQLWIPFDTSFLKF